MEGDEGEGRQRDEREEGGLRRKWKAERDGDQQMMVLHI